MFDDEKWLSHRNRKNFKMIQYVIQVTEREIGVDGEPHRPYNTSNPEKVRYVGPFSGPPLGNSEDWAQGLCGEAVEWLVKNGFVRLRTTFTWVKPNNGTEGGGLQDYSPHSLPHARKKAFYANDQPLRFVTAKIIQLEDKMMKY